MKEFDEQTLLAYVDGTLEDGEVRRAVESAIQSDAALQQTVRQLQRTPGLLRAAFEPALHHPPPPELAQHIRSYDLSTTQSQRLVPLRRAFAGLALAFFIGVVLGVLFAQHDPWSPPGNEPWLRAVAEYQALYSRDTLHQDDADRVVVRATEQRLGDQLGMRLQIPDLREHGVAFKRGQLLQFRGQPLAQLAYLPRHGQPLAYCIMPTGRADMPPTAGTFADLNYYYWHHGGYGYIVIGHMEPQELRKIANAVYGQLLVESS